MQNKIRSPADCSDNKWKKDTKGVETEGEKMSNNFSHSILNIKNKGGLKIC